MPTKNEEFITLCYNNYPDQREFVFAIKGRPFSMLSSQRLAVPSSSLIDYKLVRDLGLRIDDLQCSKFTFGGQKMRILGKISQTVQTISNGIVSGTIQLRASVVENLSEIFDSHSIAGKKITEMLQKKKNPASSPPRGESPVKTSPSPPSEPPSSPDLGRSPPNSTPRSGVKSPQSPPPPGFPSSPQYAAPKPDVSYTEPSVSVSKPPLGYVRRLQLRPAGNQFRTWNHGRVVKIPRPDCAEVEVQRLEGDPLFDTNPVFREYCRYRGLPVAVNDVVLFHTWDNSPELSYNDSKPHIMVIYNQEEVTQLKSHGIKIPDCPPELLPGGYYG